ncbi:glycoside hydrolase family 20 zincin-like fold domain-containing protein [Amycolatopsis acidiphila]|uniref:glycoside hydrolase family 20 zincin-like fold domain-containing protein n=1 Tax=Amycolatopsis acidiphila TaxID=715473 RepID=UPI001643F3DF|nr:glycoside hydrolase family 20 zincin-like fold domain-containing protein [Amycolatopsis acidiphila]
MPLGENLGSFPVLIPQPRKFSSHGIEVPVGRLVLEPASELPDGIQDYLTKLVGLVRGPDAGAPIALRLSVVPIGRESYKLTVAESSVLIEAETSLGALHAVRTLLDLWNAGDGGTLPVVEIEDCPTFETRGVFVESFAGTDRMGLKDWAEFLDRMGQLKLNTVGMSIYGCWDLHHEGERSEYLFTPLADYPGLESPRTVVTWDPGTEREINLRYLPTMFEEDLFGKVARLAAERGIELLPQLGGPGHSTLIPRVIPELSAVDEDGEPTGYGYCVSRPGARDALAKLIDNLTRQHLAPNGINRLHVAGDEYYPIRNMDPDDRKRVVSPYCRCEQCRELTPGQILMEYLLQVGIVLRRHGIGMVHWHDTLVREGVLDTYLERAEALGLDKPTIAWWKYNDPVPEPETARTETWSCPTTGFAPFLFYQDFSPNIETALRRGHSAGASGAFAYGQPEPCYQMNYAFLADLAWNLEGSGGVAGFQQRWARLTCPDDPTAAQHALTSAYTITGCYPLMMYLVEHLLPFFSTAAAGVTTFPDDLIRAFAVAQPPLADVLRQVADTLRDAVAHMPSGRDLRYWPNPVETWKQENTRTADSLELFLDVLAAARRPDLADPAELHRKARTLLKFVASIKPAYAVPAALREHWGFTRSIGPALERLRQSNGVAPAEGWYAWIV